MSYYDDKIGISGLGEWTPGAHEAECFREDLHLRIVGTAETMNRILEGQADAVLCNLRKAEAEGRLHEERADVEMAAVCDSIEHSRFTYNWAHVMLATRVLDFLRKLSSRLTDVQPKGKYSGSSEVQRLTAEFAARFGIDFSKVPVGDSFLEGMVIARNKIVHNGAMAWELSSRPDTILVEGAEETWCPSNFDQEFVERFPEYVDSADRITVTATLFNGNVEQSLGFVTAVGEQIDSFVRLLSSPPTGCLPS